jgi:hypothetical protein
LVIVAGGVNDMKNSTKPKLVGQNVFKDVKTFDITFVYRGVNRLKKNL